jgi:hypothetical protein
MKPRRSPHAEMRRGNSIKPPAFRREARDHNFNSDSHTHNWQKRTQTLTGTHCASRHVRAWPENQSSRVNKNYRIGIAWFEDGSVKAPISRILLLAYWSLSPPPLGDALPSAESVLPDGGIVNGIEQYLSKLHRQELLAHPLSHRWSSPNGRNVSKEAR